MKTQLNRWAIASLIISPIALILGAISFFRSYPRSENLGFDYIGLLVGILAILVTILIAWQIYNTIGIDARVKEVEMMQAELKTELENAKRKRELSEGEMKASIYFVQGISLLSSNIFLSYHSFFRGLESSLKINLTGLIIPTLNNLDEVCKNIEENLAEIELSVKAKDKINKCNPKSLEKYDGYPLIKERYEGIYTKIVEYITKIEERENK